MDFAEVANLARVIRSAYPREAKELKQYAESLAAVRRYGSPQDEQSALHASLSCEKICRWYGCEQLPALSIAVAERWPDLFKRMRAVGSIRAWHDTDDFDWESAVGELREIEAVALQGKAGPAAEGEPDSTSYRPAKWVCEKYGFLDQKELRAFLRAHPKVRARRPKTAEGEEDKHRLEVHIGDVAAAKDRAGATDPLALPAGEVDQAVAAVAKRRAAIDAKRKTARK